MNEVRRFRRVAVLMGGFSAEREVSLRSGRAVSRGLREAGYEVDEVDMRDRVIELPAGAEAVFVALHGEFGEDGQVQAWLDARAVPYTGSGAAASRTAFDKVASKRRFEARGVPTPAFEALRRGEPRTRPLPVVVKPARQGSTIGCHRVLAEPEWPAAFADSLAFDETAVVEAYIAGRELTVGVVGGEALPVLEIVAPGDWYDYRAKYTQGCTEYRVPAPLLPEESRRCADIALRAYAALDCRGMGRVDLRLSADGIPYVLEVNSIPGFTETSLLPKAAAARGLSFPALCDRIMGLAATG